MEQKKVNWFIGHMKKSIDVLETKKKAIDFLIEVVDARLPYTSSNKDLITIFENKPIIKIAIKSDLINKLEKKKDFVYCSTKNIADRKKVINEIEKALKEKKEKYLKKNLVNPVFVGAVVGLPNIGKSSLINFLANRKLVNAENRPGVTRKVENVKISNNLFLMDTPGIFIKNVESYESGLNLALINCVNRDVVEKKDIAFHLYKIASKYDLIEKIEKEFKVDNLQNFDDFIEKLRLKRNIHIDNTNEIDNLYLVFVKNFFDSGFSKIVLE